MMIQTPLFEVSNLSLETTSATSKRTLVEEFSIQVQPGELVGIVGETGAGKSLSVMASVGLLPNGVQPLSGKIIFQEQEISIHSTGQLRKNLGNGIALIFQNARGALNPFLRVKDQIERPLRIKGIRRSEWRASRENLMRAVGLDPDELSSKYAHEISGGQAQRVAMACALATSPRLLIADEPTTALDVTTEREVIQLFKQLCQDMHMGLVLITHNLALVSQNCQKVALMHAGHVVESGPTTVIFKNPLHPYTQGLMQAIPDIDHPHDLVPLAGSVWGGGPLESRCRFSHRCQKLQPHCTENVPPLIDYNGRLVRCFLYQN